MNPASGVGLEFCEVSFAYGSHQVLDGLSLTVRPGEMVGFLGVNGSGKTTTFLLATGFLKPDRGQVRIAGDDPRQSRTWCSKVGVVSSGAGHYQRLTVRRNLSFFAELYGVRPDLDKHIAAHGLAAYADRPAGQLSQGYRQRLSLARATLHNPTLLLLDEPSEGLDPAASEDLHQSLRRFVESGGGVLLTSHRLEEVESLCGRVLLLSEGRAVMEGSPQELGGQGAGGLRKKLLELGKAKPREGDPKASG